MKNYLFYILSGVLFCSIFAVFWWQEWQYLLPTPVPKDHQEVAIGTPLPQLKDWADIDYKKPVFLHFFNHECPCSKFNIDHFKFLVKNFSHKVNFYAVINTEGDIDKARKYFQKYYQLQSVPIIAQNGNKIAKACAVYATPQAAIIDRNEALYYKGNYNLGRYCTLPETNFAERALELILAGEPAPDFGEAALRAYGCTLPEHNE
ncbi:MAG: hypothetical protein JJT94_04900 [Bernardetiaceae bacterium]|nr:hypothetical protein [Bernardetiaceae bacterium]